MTLALLNANPAFAQMMSGGNLDASVVWTWGPTAAQFPNVTDVWSAPAVARIFDTNGDGIVDRTDDPSIIFVAGNVIQATGVGTTCTATGTIPSACHMGVLRVLNGRTGVEQYSLDAAYPFSTGFAGVSVAVGDVIGDGTVQIAAVTGEGLVVLIGRNLSPVGPPMAVLRISDKPIPGSAANEFGWGGGLAIADMNGDGFPEIAYDATVFSTLGGKITLQWSGLAGGSTSSSTALSVMANLTAGGGLQLIDGHTAYNADGTVLWNRFRLPTGFDAVADLDGDGNPDVVLVGNGTVSILNGASGAIELGPAMLPGTGSGGPPVIADFDGDGKPEIGVANGGVYSVLKPDFANQQLSVVWQSPTIDPFSSVTGSIAFDFDGTGRPSVVHSDGCFLWVFDGATGAVRYAASHTSFTGTEEPIVADVNGDGKAEIVMVSNGVDPSAWGCLDATNSPVQVNGVTWQPGAGPGQAYRGVTVFGSGMGAWAKAPAMWNEHTFHVSNINDGTNGLYPTLSYGAIPRSEVPNGSVPWLNNFRQNVQRLFTATSTTLSVSANPAIVNQPTTFTATVTPFSAMAAPSGSVTFKDATTTIGNQPLINGQAALTVSNLTVGPHLISAVYSGDGTFGESSGVLSVQIQGASCIGSNPVPCAASDQCHVAGVCDQQTGACSNPAAADGTVCNDGNACTQGDTCQGGTCVGGNAVVCTASDSCHVVGMCNSQTGLCSNPAAVDGTSCDDGLFCNGQDACFGGTCNHSGDPCQKGGGQCDPQSGACVTPGCPTGQVNCAGVCVDLNSNVNDCGACGVVCPSRSVCISAMCQAASSCSDSVKNGSETDVDCGGSACPTCVAGKACLVNGDCVSHTCSPGGVCVSASLCAGVTCTAQDQCHAAGTCDPNTGACSNPVVADGTTCSDGDACTMNDTCLAGTCAGGPPRNCDDGNPCTVDACNSVSGCMNTPGNAGVVCRPSAGQCDAAETCTGMSGACPADSPSPNGTSCNDGNACTQSDTCQAGACVGAGLVTCIALDQCHDAGTCNAGTGICSNPAKANGAVCSDGNACTHADTCQAGACVGASPVTCAALDQCHDAGVCNTGTGICSNPAKTNGAVCSDGNACTQTDTCQAGICQGTNWSWSGVLQPVNADGSSIFKLGSTVPVKFQLTGACAGITNASAHLMVAQYSNDVLGTDVEATSTSAADSGNTFRFDGQQYIFNLSTKSLSKGTWMLRINLGDGVPNRQVEISFK